MKKIILILMLIVFLVITCSKEKFVKMNEIRWVNVIDGIECKSEMIEEVNAYKIIHINMGEEILYIGYLSEHDKKTKKTSTIHKLKYNNEICWSTENILSLTTKNKSNLSFTYQEHLKNLNSDSMMFDREKAMQFHEKAMSFYKVKEYDIAEYNWYKAAVLDPSWARALYNLPV